jgi:uncharacterized membrane protein
MMVEGDGSGATSEASTDYDGYVCQYQLVRNGREEALPVKGGVCSDGMGW